MANGILNLSEVLVTRLGKRGAGLPEIVGGRADDSQFGMPTAKDDEEDGAILVDVDGIGAYPAVDSKKFVTDTPPVPPDSFIEGILSDPSVVNWQLDSRSQIGKVVVEAVESDVVKVA